MNIDKAKLCHFQACLERCIRAYHFTSDTKHDTNIYFTDSYRVSCLIQSSVSDTFAKAILYQL